MFICIDNHLLLNSLELQAFQVWFNKKKDEFIQRMIVKAIAEVIVKFNTRVEDEEKGFYVLSISDLTEYLDNLLSNPKASIKLKLQLDIREYLEEINAVNIVIHKNKSFTDHLDIDPDNYFLYSLLIAVSSYADTLWKAKKAIWKNSKSMIDAKVRQCYIATGEEVEEYIELPDTEELELEEYLDLLPETSQMEIGIVNRTKEKIKFAKALLKQLQ